MHYEIVCSVARTADATDEGTREAVLAAVAAFERALSEKHLAAVVQVHDVRSGRTLHESVHTGGLAHLHPITCAM